MEIRTVAVLGAGAVGSYFIWGLREKLGERLWVIATGSRKARLEQQGIRVNGEEIRLNVRTPEEAAGADLLLVAVKYGALEESLGDIERIADEHTIVLSLLNGVDSEEIIGRRIGREHLVYSLMKIASERKENSVVFIPSATQGVFFGEADGNTDSERVKSIVGLLDGTEVNYHVCDNIICDIWHKFALNISRNLPQAIIGCGYGAYESSVHMEALSSGLRSEVGAVAKAKGIDISDESNVAGKNNAVSPYARFSTLQDLDAGRHTEIDMFSGAMMRMGHELGIPTPYNEFTYHIIKALEEKNDQLFP